MKRRIAMIILGIFTLAPVALCLWINPLLTLAIGVTVYAILWAADTVLFN